MMKIKPAAAAVFCAAVLHGCLECKNTHPEVLATPMCFDLSPVEVIRHRRKALIDGDGEAAYNLYLFYSLGFVTDDARAAYWLRKAGELGNEKALHALRLAGGEPGKQESKPRDRVKVRFDLSPEEVIRYQEKTLIHGDKDAAYGLYLYYQLGVVSDDARAIYWLREAGELGNERALRDLYLMGLDTGKPDNEAEGHETETQDPFN